MPDYAVHFDRYRKNDKGGWNNIVTARKEESGPLEPHFPITSYVPASTCPHNQPYRKGSKFCCMVCHKSGKDHRKLSGVPVGARLNPDYKADPVATVYAPEPRKAAPETRREKRRKKFADYPIKPSQN